jgi:electron transport complex protein RnfG
MNANWLRNAALLGTLLAVAAAAVTAVHWLTAARSAANERTANAAAVLDILPRARYNNALLDDTRTVDDTALLGLRQPQKIYIARRDGAAVAAILPATARDGYAGDIDLLVGIYADGSIAGVRIIAQRETRGLGAHVTDRHWLREFIGQSLDKLSPQQWHVRKDGGVFDQFTGATVTPRAVTASVQRALHYFAAHRREIFAPKNFSATPTENERRE